MRVMNKYLQDMTWRGCAEAPMNVEPLERISMKRDHPSGVMPVPGLDPGIVAGIHVFLAGAQQERRGWPGQARQ
jgi:hypothetical protein